LLKQKGCSNKNVLLIKSFQITLNCGLLLDVEKATATTKTIWANSSRV